MKKEKLFFLFVLIALNAFAQKNQHLITGVVKESKKVVKNAHIVNLSTKQGTFSNDLGKYRIYASIGDSLQITSIQHKTDYKVISNFDIDRKEVNIYLIPNTYELDEIVIKKHDLTGNLLIDRKKTPVDVNKKYEKSINELIEGYSIHDIMKIPTKDIKPDFRGVDPTRKFEGVGGAIGFSTGNRAKKKLKKLTSNTFTTEKVIKEFGKDFFLELGFKEKEIYSFIDFCKKYGIRNLYEQNKLLQLIDLFKEKSIQYLKEIKQE